MRTAKAKMLTGGAFAALAASWSASALDIPTSGCAMAHCTPQESDAANAVVPATIGFQTILSTTTNVGDSALGCSSNLNIAACTFANKKVSTNPNLLVMDASGNVIMSSPASGPASLSSGAAASAPIVFTDNSVLAASSAHLVLFKQGYTDNVRWIGKKPDKGLPVSPTMVNDHIAFIATACLPLSSSCGMSTWDITTNTGGTQQAPLSYVQIFDPATGKVFSTRNSPAVSAVVHANDGSNLARIYLQMAPTGSTSNATGRLQALDVNLTTGEITPAWSYPVPGPGGATPLVIGNRIFFDGRGYVTDSKGKQQKAGFLFAVDDEGDNYSIPSGWASYATNGSPAGRPFIGGWIFANAAQDPRGGVWAFANGVTASQSKRSCAQNLANNPDNPINCLVRFDENTGDILQVVDMSAALNTTLGYRPSSAVTVAQAPNGDPTLLLGADGVAGLAGSPTYVLALDVAPSQATPLWIYQMAPADKQSSNPLGNKAAGQFPIIKTSDGKSRVIFEGANYGPYIIGEP